MLCSLLLVFASGRAIRTRCPPPQSVSSSSAEPHRCSEKSTFLNRTWPGRRCREGRYLSHTHTHTLFLDMVCGQRLVFWGGLTVRSPTGWNSWRDRRTSSRRTWLCAKRRGTHGQKLTLTTALPLGGRFDWFHCIACTWWKGTAW